MEQIPLKGKVLNACQRYKLGVYRERTLPVLFIPGSQGNDSSAVSTEILERQTECVANVIPFIYSLFSKKPVPLLIIGHSMGGLVAHHALANGLFDPSLVNTVLTIASPLKSPVISLGYKLQSIYKRVHDFWNNEALQPEYDHITYLSITGGVSDHLVWDGLGSIGLSVDRALYLPTQAVNQVWLTCDHRCILCCPKHQRLKNTVNMTVKTNEINANSRLKKVLVLKAQAKFSSKPTAQIKGQKQRIKQGPMRATKTTQTGQLHHKADNKAMTNHSLKQIFMKKPNFGNQEIREKQYQHKQNGHLNIGRCSGIIKANDLHSLETYSIGKRMGGKLNLKRGGGRKAKDCSGIHRKCNYTCKQLLIQINVAIFGIVNATERVYLNRQDRMDILKEIFLSHPVPIGPSLRLPVLKEHSMLSIVQVNEHCKWINRTGGSSGVFVTPMISY
ncbi:hypothetical protein ACTXT7_005277 [Hymenolepis weldensis]